MKKQFTLGALALSMIISLGSQTIHAASPKAVELFIDQESLGLVESREAAHGALKDLAVFPKLDARVQKESIRFNNKIEVKDLEEKDPAVMSKKDLVLRLRNLSKDYLVKSQGTWQEEAKKYGLDLEDLLEANKKKLTDPVPEKIYLPASKINLSIEAKEEVQYDLDVSYKTRKIEDHTLAKGKTVLVQAGKKGLERVDAKVVRVNGEKVDHLVQKVELVQAPVDEIIRIGTKEGATGSFIKPTNGRLSSPFGPRWGSFHRGIDLACPIGTQVLAADGGVVTRARTNAGSYGNYIDIDHGNGYTTRYAHLSLIEVHVGQKVSQGDPIAKSGNTGRSTGPHLHFEVCNQGNLEDPLKHIQN